MREIEKKFIITSKLFSSFSGQLEGKGSTKLTNGAWNPHQNCQQYATVNEHTVRGWDVRTMKQSWCISECFSTSVRAIDFNPNKQYQIATGEILTLISVWGAMINLNCLSLTKIYARFRRR